MKSNLKLIIIISISLIVGLVVGYIIFGSNQGSIDKSDIHNHGAGDVSTSDNLEIWTCSMHPQIRQNEPGDCPICGMALIQLEENNSDNPLVLKMTNEAVKLANIQTTIIGDTNFNAENVIRLSGKIQPDERLASSQVVHVPGRIEKLFVSFTGEKVKRGQKIATLYSPEFVTAQRELLEAAKLNNVNPDLLEAAKNKLRYWKISESAINQIVQEGLIQNNISIYADASGVVTNRRVSVGDYVKVGEPLFELMNLSKVWALFDAYEEDLSNISVGDEIEFTTPSIANKTFNTRVTFIDPVINPNTRVASIRTEISNLNGRLKPEMLVYGTLLKNTNRPNKLVVPKSAVLWTGQRSVVYLNVPESDIPSFEYREVEIGEPIGNNYEIISGLEVGEEVVTNGSFTIDAAAQLNNQVSMMNKKVSIKSAQHSVFLPDYTEITPQEFKKQLFDLASSYLDLKDAFVATDSKTAKAASEKVISVLDNIDVSLMNGESLDYWIEQEDNIKSHISKIAQSEYIEVQRNQFVNLSESLINSIKVFGLEDTALYVQHCPMVNNNKGADWLSAEEEIRNPYFGNKMLTCGLVKTKIDSIFKNPTPAK